ncbi:hypothetical protein GCM10023329_36150 [Streptomyces sanyensis]|uniref:Uncharacterized protein n=1 Tax=Streptomyces sanyensis TaxID=568869 RepID=A0ABP9ALA2_9ACTN
MTGRPAGAEAAPAAPAARTPGPRRAAAVARTAAAHAVGAGAALLVLATVVEFSAAAAAALWGVCLVTAVSLVRRPAGGTRRGTVPLPPAPARGPQGAAEAAVTRYGERIARTPLPVDATTAEDWQLALDAYERAKRVHPGLVPEAVAEGQAALERLSSAAADDRLEEEHPALWSEGSGPAVLRMPPPPGWTGRCLLVFEGEAPDGFLVRARHGRGDRRRRAVRLAHRGHGPARVRVPAPAPFAGALTVEIVTAGAWRAALVPAREARPLSGTVRGDATEVLLNRARHGAATFVHLGDGPFTVRELIAEAPRAGRAIAEGRGRCSLLLGLHGVAALLVEAEGPWTVAPAVPASAAPVGP